MNVIKQLKKDIINILTTLLKAEKKALTSNLFNKFTIKFIDKGHNFGRNIELSTNAAFILAQALKYTTIESAYLIADKLKQLSYIEVIEVAEEGYINLSLQKSLWQEVLHDILKKNINYGKNSLGIDKSCLIKYVYEIDFKNFNHQYTKIIIYTDVLDSLLVKSSYQVSTHYIFFYSQSKLYDYAQSIYKYACQILQNDIGANAKFEVKPGIKQVATLLISKHRMNLFKIEEREWLEFIKTTIFQLIEQNILDEAINLKTKHNVKIIFRVAKNLIKKNLIEIKIQPFDQTRLDNGIKITQIEDFNQQIVLVSICEDVKKRIFINDLIKKIGSDAIRFLALVKRPNLPLKVNITGLKEQSKNNSLFFIHYTYIWANYILYHASQYIPSAYTRLEKIENLSLQKISSKEELDLIKLLALWPELLQEVGTSYELHRIIRYLKTLAENFYHLWYDVQINKDLRFIFNDDIDVTVTRLALVKAVSIVINSASNIIGINIVEEI